MQSVMRGVCIAYAVFLTMLLLSRDPTVVIGCHGCLPALLQRLLPIAHLLSFAVLAALMLAVRWPMPRWTLVVVMVVYGGATEIVQGFVPPRTPEWNDWFQDMAGIVVGSLACWAAAVAIEKCLSCRRDRVVDGAPGRADEFQNNLPMRSAVVETSWWGLKRPSRS